MVRTPTPIRDRILSNIIQDSNGCWLWQLRKSKTGYGQICVKSGREGCPSKLAHRESYLAFKGSIPEGLQIDHLCKVRSCVNPDHLEAVTSSENVRRSDARYKEQMRRTHCPRGHEYTIANIYFAKTRIGGVCRNCKTCVRAKQNEAKRIKRLQYV